MLTAHERTSASKKCDVLLEIMTGSYTGFRGFVKESEGSVRFGFENA